MVDRKLFCLLICLGVTLLAASVPFCRAFYRVEIDYNEGWNLYNAAFVAAHQPLYPARYDWVTNNYPMLSFVILARLQRWGHHPLIVARVVSLLSLLCSAGLVGTIVLRLDATRVQRRTLEALVPSLQPYIRGGIYAALFTVALFCANADVYVGMDDPQMLAQVFFLAGLYVYLSTGRTVTGIAITALLFVLGGFIKHNLIDFPLTVLLDLVLMSRAFACLRKTVWFILCGFVLLAAGVALSIHFGGPYFISQVLAHRNWSLTKASLGLRNALGPILLPVAIAVFMAIRLSRDPARRVLAIFLATSLLVGGYFGGGQGVATNALFDAMLATAILVGLFFCEADAGTWSSRTRDGFIRNWPGWVRHLCRPQAAFLLFLWLFIPLIISGNWNPTKVLHEISAGEVRFDLEVATIAARPGLALCESPLRCYQAGKPYVYDPCNATRLIQLGKLDQTPLLLAIRNRAFGVIQLDIPPDDEFAVKHIDPALLERFTPEMLSAIQQNYRPALSNEDGVIYVPAMR